jgi:hypothetical protein
MKVVYVLVTVFEKHPPRLNDYDKVNGSHAKRKSGPAQRMKRINILTENLNKGGR